MEFEPVSHGFPLSLVLIGFSMFLDRFLWFSLGFHVFFHVFVSFSMVFLWFVCVSYGYCLVSAGSPALKGEDAYWVAWRCADGRDVQRWYHLPTMERQG